MVDDNGAAATPARLEELRALVDDALRGDCGAARLCSSFAARLPLFLYGAAARVFVAVVDAATYASRITISSQECKCLMP